MIAERSLHQKFAAQSPRILNPLPHRELAGRVFSQARSRVDDTDLFSRPSEGSGVPKGMVINHARWFRLIRSQPRQPHFQPVLA